MTVAKEKQATLASVGQVLAVGADIGNGHTKLIVDLTESRQPSYYLPIQKSRILDIPSADDGGMVEYLSGDRSDLVGQVWFTGSLAYQQSPSGCLRVVDDAKGKQKFGLQLLLGGLATYKAREQWHLSIVASIQDAQVHGSELRAALEGTHRVRFGNGSPVDVFIDVQRVVEEGAGSIIHARPMIDTAGQTILLDLGSGTSILSVFGAKGKLMSRKVFPDGVERLIDAVATSLDTRKQLGQEGDRQIIRAGIENGTFQYGLTSWNFQDIYTTELKHWILSTLAPAVKFAAPWLPTSSAFLAVGGGSQLPLISELLVMKGIQPVTDGHWSNCRGLARIAFLTLKGGN